MAGAARGRGHNEVEPAATAAGVRLGVDCRDVARRAGEVLAFREMCRQWRKCRGIGRG